jgi:surface antigen
MEKILMKWSLYRMNRLFVFKPLVVKSIVLMGLSLSVSGCLYGTSGVAMQDQPQTQTADQARLAANGTTADKAAEPVKLSSGGPLAGYIDQFMDANDKTKMARALDGGLGKAVSWTNPVSSTSFAVTPLRKVSLGGDGICRAYNVNMTKGGVVDRVSGTACIGEDGLWHVSG